MYLRTPSRFGLRGVGLGDALVSSLASAIRDVEGYNPNFAGNNNPGNLIYVGQKGATLGPGGFAKFPTPEAGEAALEWQIQNYIDRGYNLNQFLNTWAPPNTKNAAGGAQTSQMTNNYISRVSAATGIDPLVSLKSVQGGYAGGGGNDTAAPDTSSAGDSGSYDPTPAGFDLASYFPGSDASYSVGGVVLSGSDLWLLGAAIAGVVVLTAVL